MWKNGCAQVFLINFVGITMFLPLCFSINNFEYLIQKDHCSIVNWRKRSISWKNSFSRQKNPPRTLKTDMGFKRNCGVFYQWMQRTLLKHSSSCKFQWLYLQNISLVFYFSYFYLNNLQRFYCSYICCGLRKPEKIDSKLGIL